MKLTRRVVKTQVTTTTTLSSTFHDLFEHEDVQPLISVTEIDPLKLLDNSDSELVDLLKGHSLPTNQQQHRKLAKTLKLSPKHQQQVKELNKATFTGHPSDPDTTGRFPEAVDFVKQHWAQIKKCINEGRPIYLIGAVQIGKTIVYNAIVYLAINGFTRDDGTQEPPLVDLALILTMNLTSSGDKNQEDSQAYLNDHRDRRDILTVVDIKEDKVKLAKRTVVHAIGNGSQLKKVHETLCQAISKDQEFQKQIKGEFKPWRLLVIHDESDQANPNLADANAKGYSKTEDMLNTVLQAKEYTAHYCAVTATMLSDFAIYDKIGKHRHGDMIPEQIFHLPVDEHYKGFVKKDTGGNPVFNPDFVQTGMISEPKNGTHNPGFIADKMFYHYNDSHTNPYGLPQIATVNLTKETKGHAAIAKLIEWEMNKKCPGSTKVMDFPDDVRSEFVIVTHNGEDKSEISAKNKILEIYKSAEANGINLKGIVFVGGWKVSRAITFSTRDRDHAYCNLSFTAPPKGRIEREAMIQSARCSGRYSDLKTHVFYTTAETKASIENYYNVFYGDFLPCVGKGTQAVSEWITKFDITYNGQPCTQKTSLGKHIKSRHMDITGPSKHRATRVLANIDQARRDNYINQGLLVSNQSRSVLALDYYWQITKAEYDQLIGYDTDKTKIAEFLQQKGIARAAVNRVNNDIKNTTLAPGGLSYDKLRDLYYHQAGSVTTWQATTGEYVLYYYAGLPTGSSQKGIKYKLELDAQGKVKFLGHAGQTSKIEEPRAQPTSSNAQVGTMAIGF